jgi:diadenosine tetraphosphate (Ap4A) HIT family hydrolase
MTMVECKMCAYLEQYYWIKEHEHWKIGVSRGQITLGNLFIVLKRHELFLANTTAEEFSELHTIIKEAKTMLDNAFKPDWYNTVQLTNSEPHLHIHIIPRYRERRVFEGQEFLDSTYGAPYTPATIKQDEKFIKSLSQFLRQSEQKNGTN